MMQSQHPPSNYQNNQQNLDDFDSVWVPNPLGQTSVNSSPTGLIDIIKSGSLDSLLTNPWLVSIFVATIISVLIGAIATILAGQRSTELTPEQEAQQALLQKSKNLEQTDNNFREYLTRNDYGSGLVSNPGLLQAATLEAGVRYRNRIISSQNNPKNPAYNQHEEVINYNSEIEALKRINLGASGKEAQLKYVDPSTGLWVTRTIDSAELAASGLTKLNIISNSRRETTQRFDLVTVAQNIRKILSEVKAARLEALRVKGLSPVASELEKTDWFGNKASPSEAEISDYQQYKPRSLVGRESTHQLLSEPIPANPNTSKQPKDKPSSKPTGGQDDK